MRWIAVLLLALPACVPGADDPADEPTPTPGERVTQRDGGHELPAAEPPRPSLDEFAGVARAACAEAVTVISAAALEGDPLARSASPRDVRAAVAHYRAVAAAWTAAAGSLWEFGLPDSPKGARLMTAMDTVALNAQRVADALAAGDENAAQEALGATAEASRSADRAALSMGLGRLADCGAAPVTLPDARRVVVRATDHAFQVQLRGTPLQAGPTRFILRNEGDEDHQMFLVRLRSPGTLADAVAADRRGDSPGPFLRGTGHVTTVVGAGERASVDVRLRRGPYGLICFVPSPDGTPHAYKGMATEVPVG